MEEFAFKNFEKFLSQICYLDICVKDQNNQIIKKGHAEVKVTHLKKNEYIFQEKGNWLRSNDLFFNKLLWIVDEKEGMLSLSHLRQEKPQFLFTFIPKNKSLLIAQSPHICSPDIYEAQIEYKLNKILYRCKVIGPKKHQHLTYTYSTHQESG